MRQELVFERSSHSADAIQRAAYRFADRFTIEMASEDDLFRCTLDFAVEDPLECEQAVRAFRGEVLDQVLRERIREETRDVRNVILSLAFSNTGLVES